MSLSKISLVGIVGVVLVAGLTVAVGVIHGRMTGRWGVPSDTRVAAERLKQFPEEFGNWRVCETAEVGKVEREMLQLSGAISRTYQNTQTGETVSAVLFIGAPCPLAEHTPEICLDAQAYSRVRPRQKVVLASPQEPNDANAADEFWQVDFRPRHGPGPNMRVYYAWNKGTRWQAPPPGLWPGHSRFEFAGSPYLYKIQASCLLPRRQDDTAQQADDSCKRFLQDVLPILSGYLIEPSGS